MRLAGTYRDDYLDELGGSPEEDRYVDSHFQLDASARYRFNDNVQVFVEGVNLNNAEFFAFIQSAVGRTITSMRFMAVLSKPVCG